MDNILGCGLSPFTRCCLNTLPLTFDDSLSYYECLCKIAKVVEEHGAAINENAVKGDELAQGLIDLKKWSEDYFKSLDIQTEINAKLDAMADDGTLVRIINEYLKYKTVRPYAGVIDMKMDAELKDGDYTKTAGYYGDNDGGAGSYIITTQADKTKFQERLDNGLYATLIVKSNAIEPAQVGVNPKVATKADDFQKIIDKGYDIKIDLDYTMIKGQARSALLVKKGHKIIGHGKLTLINTYFIMEDYTTYRGVDLELSADYDNTTYAIFDINSNNFMDEGKQSGHIDIGEFDVYKRAGFAGKAYFALTSGNTGQASQGVFDVSIHDIKVLNDGENVPYGFIMKGVADGWITTNHFYNIWLANCDTCIKISGSIVKNQTFDKVMAQHRHGSTTFAELGERSDEQIQATFNGSFCYDLHADNGDYMFKLSDNAKVMVNDGFIEPVYGKTPADEYMKRNYNIRFFAKADSIGFPKYEGEPLKLYSENEEPNEYVDLSKLATTFGVIVKCVTINSIGFSGLHFKVGKFMSLTNTDYYIGFMGTPDAMVMGVNNGTGIEWKTINGTPLEV